jgi:hypothetical protein
VKKRRCGLSSRVAIAWRIPFAPGPQTASATARGVGCGLRKWDELHARSPAPLLWIEVHQVVCLGGKPGRDREPQGLRLGHGDRVVVRVVAAGELLGDRLGAVLAEARDDQLADDLLHVAKRLLGDVREEERTVVQSLEGLLPGDAHESRRRKVTQLRVDGSEHAGLVHEDLVRGERDQRAARHGVVRNEDGDLPGVRAYGVRDLLGCEHEPAGRMEEQVDRALRRCLPDRPQNRLGVVDVDEAVEGDAEDPDGLLTMDHGDHVGAARPLESREGTSALCTQRPLPEHGRAEENEDQEEDPDREDGAEVDRARIRPGAASISAMDGALDWYVLGVVLGLGVAAGAAVVGALGAPAWTALAVLAGVAALALVLALLPLWTIAAFAVALVIAFVSLRRLSAEAMPAAVLGAIVLAAIPLLGYLAVVVTPLAGARLSRRADTRHAGLRILAKD